MPNTPNKLRMIDVRHPFYVNDSLYWEHWRETYDGGAEYVRKYLKKFSERETDTDFNSRVDMTPTPRLQRPPSMTSVIQSFNDSLMF